MAASTRFAWAKGHGTENDFVLLPDPDGSVHGALDPGFVAALCHRRRGIGADGVLRVVRSSAVADAPDGAEWFMDYRNGDGSLSQMCGNGIRVFARWLAEEGVVDPAVPLAVGTRGGIKVVSYEGDGRGGDITVDMGVPELLGTTWVEIAGRRVEARHVDMGNPHAVALVDGLDLDALGPLLPPGYDHALYPEGVNVELVQRADDRRRVRMRVHERGSGETRSCGTGVCAAAVAEAASAGATRPVTYHVDVPGGGLQVTWRTDDHVVLTGPAMVVARGDMAWTG
ncbi:MAG: diaminopimelate epimerase [Nocardioidaceae bacterium]|nr:diaminopimelate epimerase [Nocardioidaceae bacterium]